MAERKVDTRERMVRSAAALLQHRSAAGVSIDAVLAHSGAPRGSVYHHFPGGRDELIVDAVRLAGERIAAVIARADTRKPSTVVETFVTFWRRELVESDFRAGCPVVALAVDGRDEPDVVTEVFALWHTTLRTLLVAAGLDLARSARLAHLCVAAVEGAILLCRARRDTVPLDDVGAELGALLRSK